MVPQSDTLLAFAFMHHQDLQAENAQVRRAMAAVPSQPVQLGLPRRARNWLGAVLLRLGTALVVETREPPASPELVRPGAS